MGQVLSSSSKPQAADDLAKEYVPTSNNISDSTFGVLASFDWNELQWQTWYCNHSSTTGAGVHLAPSNDQVFAFSPNLHQRRHPNDKK